MVKVKMVVMGKELKAMVVKLENFLMVVVVFGVE